MTLIIDHKDQGDNLLPIVDYTGVYMKINYLGPTVYDIPRFKL